jgi:hypothetical protein
MLGFAAQPTRQIEKGRKMQSFRKASIAEGVLRRMVVDHSEPSFSLLRLIYK